MSVFGTSSRWVKSSSCTATRIFSVYIKCLAEELGRSFVKRLKSVSARTEPWDRQLFWDFQDVVVVPWWNAGACELHWKWLPYKAEDRHSTPRSFCCIWHDLANRHTVRTVTGPIKVGCYGSGTTAERLLVSGFCWTKEQLLEPKTGPKFN